MSANKKDKALGKGYLHKTEGLFNFTHLQNGVREILPEEKNVYQKIQFLFKGAVICDAHFIDAMIAVIQKDAAGMVTYLEGVKEGLKEKAEA